MLNHNGVYIHSIHFPRLHLRAASVLNVNQIGNLVIRRFGVQFADWEAIKNVTLEQCATVFFNQ